MLEILNECIREYKMRMNLLTTVLAEVEQVAASGEFVDFPTEMAGTQEEELIGVVNDPHLRALITVYGKYWEKAKNAIDTKVDKTENAFELLAATKDLDAIVDDTNALREIMWQELRASFGEKGKKPATVGLRPGWNFVAVKRVLPMELPSSLETFRLLLSLSEDCGNPNCPIHHPVPASAFN